jgi:hypothetical protein
LNNNTERERLDRLFESRALLHPLDDVPSSMALFRAVASLCGIEDLPEEAGVETLRSSIGPAEHYIFILVDGLGMNLEPMYPKGGFFDTTFHTELRAVFPSTTASVLTSLATGLWPSKHAILGWNTHLPEYGRTVKPILFLDRKTGKPLKRFGLKLEDVFLYRSLLPRYKRKNRSYLPSSIAGETYSRYCQGHTAYRGSRSFTDLTTSVATRVKRARKPTYTHVYCPYIDKEIHKSGLQSEKVAEQMAQIDAAMLWLWERVGQAVRIIVTSDHGLINIPKKRHLVLRDDNELMEQLVVPPSGESRLPIFHLKEGREEAFLSCVEKRLAKHFIMVKAAMAEEMRLFGPEPLWPETKSRLGDYIGIADGASILEYVPPGDEPRNFVGFHGGLSPDEMRVPLFLA